MGATSTPGTGEQATFTSFDLSNGSWCFRVLVNNPNTGVNSYSGYVSVVIPATGDTTAPQSTLTNLTSSGGFANTLDAGDKIELRFNESMSVASNSTIRVSDSDCGQPTGNTLAACSGGLDRTVADINCATNATCTLDTFGGVTNARLIVLMTGNPTIVTAGSVAGAQYAIVVTDSSGITDLSGNAWDLANSGDRAVGPAIGQ